MSLQPFHVRGGLNADGQRVMKIADPVAADDAVNLRTLQSQSGVHFVARLSNLPSVQDPDPTLRPLDGQLYFVKYDLAGNRIDRLYSFDNSVGHTGPIATLLVESDDPADAATITALAATGAQDAGRPLALSGNGTGAIVDLIAQPYGVLTATIQNAGTGYAIGDKETGPGSALSFPGLTGNITMTVTRLNAADPMGGYREVNIRDWIKPTVAEGDQRYGMQSGDLEFITETSHEAIKVYDGSSWVTIFSTDKQNAAIASLSLFEGTSQEVGGAVPGAVAFDTMPDLTATDAATAAANLAKVGHYWTYVGTAGRAIVAGDPNGIGRDLVSAVMQVGDWIQIANRGTATAPNLVYVHIGGDLLAKSRADVLYGLKAWAAGNYEKDSLVNYQGSIWRATDVVAATDSAPGTAARAAAAGPPAVTALRAAPWEKIPLTAGVHNVPTDADLPATASPSEVYLVLNSTRAGNKPGLFSYDVGTTAWVMLGGTSGVTGLNLSGGELMLSIGCPIGTIVMWASTTMPVGWLELNGQAISATDYPELAALFPSGRLPDLRGGFPRMWGTGRPLNLTIQRYSTALPRTTAFRADAGGSHSHNMMYAHGTAVYAWGSDANGIWPGDSNWGNAGPQIVSNAHTSTTSAHGHTISGGDAETAPDHFCLGFIIKAIDHGVRKRAAATPATP